MHITTRHLQLLALNLHLALLGYVVCWHGWLSPHPHLSLPFMLSMWAIPLLLPLPGMLKGKPYTFAWANFILMLYFTHSLTLLGLNDGELGWAIGELLLTSSSFAGNVLYVRKRGRELGLGLKKRAKQAQVDSR